MDNVCHTLVGAAMGEAGLKRRTPFGNATLMISANLPDVDALVFLLDTPSVAFRRGWTHGAPAQALLPVVLTAAIVGADRLLARRAGRAPRVRPGAVLALSYAGVLSHVGLDYLNTYGVRLLMPISGRWFYGDAVFIVDPWLWLVLGAGVFWARRRGRLRAARAALLAATVYIAAMFWLAAASRQVVLRAWQDTHGANPPGLMVGPVPVHPFRKQIIVDAGTHYITGDFQWWPRDVRFDPDLIPKNLDHPAVRRAASHPDVRAVLVWARFPYYQVTPVSGGIRVSLLDARYGARVGTASVVVPPDGRGE